MGKQSRAKAARRILRAGAVRGKSEPELMPVVIPQPKNFTIESITVEDDLVKKHVVLCLKVKEIPSKIDMRFVDPHSLGLFVSALQSHSSMVWPSESKGEDDGKRDGDSLDHPHL